MHYRFALLAVVAAQAASTAPAFSDAPPAVRPAVVHIDNFAFVPATLTIRSGETVRFINDDAEAHTVTARDARFDSTGLDEHDSWQHVFAQPGTYAYYCQLHPMMTGTIVVRAEGAR